MARHGGQRVPQPVRNGTSGTAQQEEAGSLLGAPHIPSHGQAAAEYAAGVEERIGAAIDEFERRCQEGKQAVKDGVATEYTPYEEGFGVWTRTSADTPEYMERRHAFFVREMLSLTDAVKKDPIRGFTGLEREAVYLRDGKKCLVCVMNEKPTEQAEVAWSELEVQPRPCRTAMAARRKSPMVRACTPDATRRVWRR